MLYCPQSFWLENQWKTEKDFFFVLLGQYSTFHQKDLFYWDSTALSASGLLKVLYCPNKESFWQEGFGRLKKLFFFFIGTVQHFSPKRFVLLGQYSTF